MKILVVEDKSTVAQAIEALLVSHHYGVDIAPDSPKGLEMASTDHYDLLLLDLGLPDQDGVSLCQQIRSQKIQTPILLLTSQEVDAQTRAAALNAGADDYVTQPFDPEELLGRMQTLLWRGELQALPHAATTQAELEQQVTEQTAEQNQPEALFRSIYEGLEHPIFVVAVTETGDFRYVTHNRACQKVTGISLEDFQGQTPEAVFGPELGAQFRHHYEHCVQANHSSVYEDHFVFQGRRYWTLTTLAPLYDATGRLDRLVGTTVDVSDRKQLELALRESEALHRTLFDSIDEGVCLVERLPPSPDGLRNYRYVAINPAMQTMFGLSDLNSQSIRDTFPDEVESWFDDYDRVLETGQPIRFERQSEPQGMVLEMFITRVEDGARKRLLVVMQNVTERKRAEAALQDSEEKFRQLVELAPQMFWNADAQGHTYISPQLSDYTGMAREQLRGFDWSQVIHPDDFGRTHRRWQKSLQTGAPYEVEYRLRRADGEYRWHLVRAVSIEYGQGRQWFGLSTDIHDRKQLELALQDSQAQLSRILENAGAAIGELMVYPDRSYVHGFYSAGCEQVYGYTQAEMMEDKALWLSRVVPEDVETVILPGYEQIFAEKSFTIEYRFRDKTDALRWLSETLVSRWDEAAKCWQVTTVAIDISDRKQAELALRESQTIIQQQLAEIETIYQSAPIGLNVLDTDLRFVRINQRLAEMNGLSVAAHFGRTVREVLPGLADRAEPLLRTVLATGEPLLNVEITGETPAQPGVQRIWLASFLPLKDGDRVIGINTVCEEITERKRAELALKQSEAQNRAILAALPDLILRIDADGIYRAVYDAGCHFEVLPINAVGRSMFEVLPTQVAEQDYTYLQRALQTGELQVFEQAVQLSDRLQYEEVRVIKSGDDEVLFVIRDITDKKNLEAQFYQAQRLESLGTLAGGIAHDLNNILTPILTTAQLLRLTQKGLNAQGLEQINLLETSAKRGANLVKQILTVTRASQGEQTPVDLAAVLQEEIEIIRQSFSKAITIRADFPSSQPSPAPLGMVLADPTYLHQIILNLCVNAHDAMADGGTLTLSAAKVFVDEAMAAQILDAQVGHYAVVTVADTGTGISPEVQGRMFDPFFTTKPPGKGTGLGLATVRGLVKANQGFIQVFSQVGEGTQFKVYFPLMVGDVSQPASTQPALEAVTDHPEAVVLVVEDEALVRSMLQAMLEIYHYRPLLSQDGAEALALYRQHQSAIQLVVTDLMMPTMDGFTFIENLRTMNAEVPIIALSGVPTHGEKALAAGATRFVAKPFDLETLLGQIATLLNPIDT